MTPGQMSSCGGSPIHPAPSCGTPISQGVLYQAHRRPHPGSECFSLKMAHLSCACRPLARRDHMAHLQTRGTQRGGLPMDQEPVMGDPGNLYHKGPVRNDFPRITWLSWGTDGMDTMSAQLQNPHSPTTSHSATKGSFASKENSSEIPSSCSVKPESEAPPRAAPTISSEDAQRSMATQSVRAGLLSGRRPR